MDYAKESLRLHEEWGGKIEVIATVPVKDQSMTCLWPIRPAWRSPAWKFRRM